MHKPQFLNYQVDTWKFQDYFYKCNGFKLTLLIFKVQTYMLPVKANFKSQKMFSAKCPMCLLKQYLKTLNDMQKLFKSSSKY